MPNRMLSYRGSAPVLSESTGIDSFSCFASKANFLMTKYECVAIKNCIPIFESSWMISKKLDIADGCNADSISSINITELLDR